MFNGSKSQVSEILTSPRAAFCFIIMETWPQPLKPPVYMTMDRIGEATTSWVPHGVSSNPESPIQILMMTGDSRFELVLGSSKTLLKFFELSPISFRLFRYALKTCYIFLYFDCLVGALSPPIIVYN